MTDANNDRTIRLLEGIKVTFEFAQNLAIPMCGRILAGMGADVVKVEPPTGDAMRSARDFGPTEAKAYSLINPDKRSIAVDLGSPQATQVIEGFVSVGRCCAGRIQTKRPGSLRHRLGPCSSGQSSTRPSHPHAIWP